MNAARRRRERGASLPETAIIMVVLLLVLFGIVDFGRAMYTYAFVAQLAREGARFAIVRGANCTLLSDCPNVTSAQIQSYVQSLNEGVTNANANNSGGLYAAAAWSCPLGASPSEEPGCTVAVTVSYNYNPIFPYIPVGTLKLSSTSEMVISQ